MRRPDLLASTLKRSALCIGCLAAAFLSACLQDGDEPKRAEVSATIQAFHHPGDGSGSVTLIVMEGLRASCYAPPGEYEPQDSILPPGPKDGTLAGFDSGVVDLDDLTLGVHAGTAQRLADLYINVYPAEITLTAITDSTVSGSLRIRDTTGAVIKKKTAFKARKCPVYRFEE
jgi:hypothetical protein